ncbi:hypothetical protein AB4089_02120 [Arthrobacter sp. 2MCAF15]
MLEIYRSGERLTSHLLLLLRTNQYRTNKAGVHADAIMDRTIHNTIWVETGNCNLRERTALATA